MVRQELAAFLTSRREALQPEDVGLVRSGRRRVKGLRRHEVADLATVSVTWYTWLEQGREIHVSSEVLDSVARALRMDEDSRRHLRRLAGVPLVEPKLGSMEADASLVALVEDVMPSAAYILTPANDFLAWNRAFAVLYGDPELQPPGERNSLYTTLLSPECRNGIVDWEAEAADVIARFRAEAGKFPEDPRIKAVIANLTDRSPLFRRLWREQKVHRFKGYIQVMNHQSVGVMRLHLLELRPVDQAQLIFMVHRPTDDESRSRLERLLATTEAVSTS
jgi:transcriptional regulator with XRE-family HTH domain